MGTVAMRYSLASRDLIVRCDGVVVGWWGGVVV